MIVRAKAPLRLGLAGGGTDIYDFSNLHGGAVLNVTINMYAHTTIKQIDNNKIIFDSKDLNIIEEASCNEIFLKKFKLKLHFGVYKRIIEEFNDNNFIGVMVTTYTDSPMGSGLGSSSSLVVSMIKAYVELLNLPLGEYDIAELAYSIEREDLKLKGGRQDQYAATFGGFNFIEFAPNQRVIVNPLRVRQWIRDELAESILLYFTGQSRVSSNIIADQVKQSRVGKDNFVKRMLDIKQSAYDMKMALLKMNIDDLAKIMNHGWELKKQTSKLISNPMIEEIYNEAMNGYAKAAKISGAGGGGFFIFIIDPLKKRDLIDLLDKYPGYTTSIEFVEHGTRGWYL